MVTEMSEDRGDSKGASSRTVLSISKGKNLSHDTMNRQAKSV